MAVTVDVLKLTQVQGVVAVRGTDATGTIALATTLKKSSETITTPNVNIKGIHWTLSASCRAYIQRSTKILYELSGSGHLDFYGWSDVDQNAQDIAVVIAGGNGGTVVVECAKVSGYGPQQHQNQGALG